MNELIIFTAEYVFLANVVIWGIYLLRHQSNQKVRFVIYTLVAAALALALAKTGNYFFENPRPFVVQQITPLIEHEADNGFPSDHTLITAFLAFVVFFKNRRWGAAMLLVALAVGASRVAALVHHPLDIAGSFVFAALGVAIAWWADRQLSKSR